VSGGGGRGTSGSDGPPAAKRALESADEEVEATGLLRLAMRDRGNSSSLLLLLLLPASLLGLIRLP
jgi:hypothetical protein